MNAVPSFLTLSRPAIFAILFVVLALYFSYHLAFGIRGVPQYLSLKQDIAILSVELVQLQDKSSVLRHDVMALRPGSLEPDFLDQRARIMLGYVQDEEQVITGM